MTTIGVILAVVLTFEGFNPPAIPRPDLEDTYWYTRIDGPVVVGDWKFTPSVWTQWVIPDASDTDDRPWMYLSPWFGFDNSVVMEAADGHRFNFTGFDSIGLQNGPAVATSSNGHTLHYVSLRHMARHYEVSWQNIEWIRFDNHDFNHQLGANGVDNIRVSPVWEPSTLELLGCGFAGLLLFAVSRKLRWQ
jgi:hypothetical protein